MEKLLFTSESVTEGHPDKICDQISDSILDALLEQDPMSRVACETCVNTGFVLLPIYIAPPLPAVDLFSDNATLVNIGSE